jgi:ribose transport system substrate-binding protein
MSDNRRKTTARTAAWATLLLSAALIATGCGGSDEGSGGTTGAKTGGGLAKVREQVKVLMSAQGTYEEPPATSPKPLEGKTVALISCGQSLSSCANPIRAAKEAAEALGWKTTLFDTKGDFAVADTGVRNAIVAHADAIFIYYIDCSFMRGALREAQDAGVIVVAAESFDCDFRKPEGEKLFSGQVTYAGGQDYDKWDHGIGQAAGLYAISQLEGKANAAIFADNTGYGSVAVAEGWEQALKQCDGCEINIDYFPTSAFETGLQQRADQFLIQHPDTNVVGVSYEAITLSGIEASARTAGRDLLLYIGEGGPGGMDLVRRREAATYGVGISQDWEGWAGIDAINRLMHDEQPVSSGIGHQVFTQDRNLPASGGYKPPVDFKAAYRKAWGVSE